MIEYREQFDFTNSLGEFHVNAYTTEHPSGYGNGTVLVFEIESEFPCEKRMFFDVRYAEEGIESIVRRLVEEKFGVQV